VLAEPAFREMLIEAGFEPALDSNRLSRGRFVLRGDVGTGPMFDVRWRRVRYAVRRRGGAITSSDHSWAGPGWVASAGALRPRNARAIVPQPASQKYRERAAFPLLNFAQASLTFHASDSLRLRND
jgi:hypothetical protein